MPSLAAVTALLTETRARRKEQWLTPDELRARRLARLRRLAAVAARTPYWASVFDRAGLRPDTLDDGPALERLPILDKATVQEHTTEMLTAHHARLFTVRTSGSTGRPAVFYRTERDQAEVSAIHGRIASVFGRRAFDRQVSIGSGFAAASKGPIALLRRIGLLPPMHRLSSLEPVQAQVAAVQRLKPHTINGYSVALEQLAEAVLAAGIHDLRPRLVYTGSMATTDRCRLLIQEAFGVRPLDVYAIIEAGPLAFECPESPGDYHLNDDVQLLEIVDERGRRLPDGEAGEVVITPLTLFGQPLLRYRVSDVAGRRAHRCVCGRGLALLGPVEGRTRQIIRTPDGRALNAAGIQSAFRAVNGVRRWQVHQTSLDVLRVLLMTGPEWTEATQRETLALLRARVGTAVQIQLVPVEEIPMTAGGKLQVIVPLPEEDGSSS